MKIAIALLVVALVGCYASKTPVHSNSPPGECIYWTQQERDTVYVMVQKHDTVFVSKHAPAKKRIPKCHEVIDIYQMCPDFSSNPWWDYISNPSDPNYTTNPDTLDRAILELKRTCPQKRRQNHYDYPVDLSPEDYVMWVRQMGINISKRLERIIVEREASDYAEFLIGGIVVRYWCVPDD